MGWRYATAKDDKAYDKLSPEQKDEEAKKFRDNPGNAYKEGSAGDKRYKARKMGKTKRGILGGSGGT